MSTILNSFAENNGDNSNLSWYVNFNIKKYMQIDDVLDIINLIDDKIMGDCKIYGTPITINICKSPNTHYDYICITDKYCLKNTVSKFLDYKFKQIENIIKFYHDKYGFDWYIDYKLNDFAET